VSRARPPGAHFSEGDLLVGRQFGLVQGDLTIVGFDVIGDDDLVHPSEGVDAYEFTEHRIEPQLFFNLAKGGFLRCFAPFQKTRYETKPIVWPADALNQDDVIVSFDNGGHHRGGIVPEDETATRIGATPSHSSTMVGIYQRTRTAWAVKISVFHGLIIAGELVL